MAKVINELSVCELCLQVIANGDYSSIDYHYNGQEADDKVKAIDDGLDAWSKYGHVVPSDEDYGFCRTPCDVCGDELHGDRYGAAVLD